MNDSFLAFRTIQNSVLPLKAHPPITHSKIEKLFSVGVNDFKWIVFHMKDLNFSSAPGTVVI